MAKNKKILNRQITDWDKWLIKDNFKSFLVDLEKFYKKLSDDSLPDYFTPHDENHCFSVDKLAKALISKSNIDLSEFEKFILFVCIWTHDIGMLTEVATPILGDAYKPDNKRKDHEIIGAKFLSTNKKFLDLFERNGINENLAMTYINTINLINKFHRRKYSLSDCPQFRYIKGEKIRSSLIASILRLSDTLHIDTSRYDRKKYDILQIGNFDRTSRLHWLKSYVVSSVYLDIDKQSIFITLDLPDIELEQRVDFEENIINLKSIIYEDVYEDIIAVQNIFRQYNLPFYSLVSIDINYIVGMESTRAQEIKGIINDLHILLSPSTSKVIRKSLDSIQSLVEIDFKTYEIFYKQVGILIDHLKSIHEYRPCHVGLKKIIDTIETEYLAFPNIQTGTKADIKKSQKLLKEKIEQINKTRTKAIKKLQGHADELLAYENILLFGISEIVSGLLKSCDPQFKEKVNIYIFECGSKRQFSPSNSLEYNDGLQYSFLLSSYGLKNISLLPDNSIASLLSDPKIDNKKTILLFGANGIEKDSYNCGHSSGHLTMAIVANHFNIPIWIITDSYKIGTIDWKPDLQRVGTLWLTGQKKWISECQQKNIDLKNYREDTIPFSMVDRIIFENEIVSPNAHDS